MNTIFMRCPIKEKLNLCMLYVICYNKMVFGDYIWKNMHGVKTEMISESLLDALLLFVLSPGQTGNV